MSDTPHDLTPFTSELRSLSPDAGHLDRDQLMFRAGQASLPRRSRLWPLGTGVLSMLSLSLLAVVLLRPEPMPIERIVYVPASEPPLAVVASDDQQPRIEPPPGAPFIYGTTAESRYLRYRDQVIHWGPGALPRPTTDHAPMRGGDLRYQLDMPPGSLKRGPLIGGQTF